MQLKRCSSVKKLPIMYVLDRYKTREVCGKVEKCLIKLFQKMLEF